MQTQFQPKILLIDDDEKLNRLLQDFIAGFGFQVTCATDPALGLKILKENPPDLILLDVMLPGMNGFDVCRLIRHSHSVPIIMLTARGEIMDKVVGLEIGADDYLAKPFEPRELVARIKAVLRRSRQLTQSDIRCYGRLQIDFQKQSAWLGGVVIELTTTEFAALALLCRQPGRVFNRDQILEELRGMECDAFNRSVDITMSRLRQKLKDNPKSPAFIKTVWGTGYLFMQKETSPDD